MVKWRRLLFLLLIPFIMIGLLIEDALGCEP